MVQIGGCFEAQSLAWPVVQVIGDVIALGLRDRAHASTLGQVLSKQAVEILVAAALPRVIRRSEVDLHWEALFEQSVVMELGSVVEGDRLEPAAVLSDGSGGSSGHPRPLLRIRRLAGCDQPNAVPDTAAQTR